MGFAAKKKTTVSKTGTKAKAKKSTLVNIGVVWESKKKEGVFYITTNKSRDGYEAPGKLLFQDANTGQLYLINSVAMYEPKGEIRKKLPNLAFNLVLHLDNEDAATPIGGAEDTGADVSEADYDADVETEEGSDEEE